MSKPAVVGIRTGIYLFCSDASQQVPQTVAYLISSIHTHDGHRLPFLLESNPATRAWTYSPAVEFPGTGGLGDSAHFSGCCGREWCLASQVVTQKKC